MTDSLRGLKILIGLAVLGLLSLAILLWFKTPQMFEYFNQAFCPH
ncbi:MULTISPECIES: hypothetical protein [Acinetobacter]|jgi:hypothetical protein|nr:hypothetical protein [Acinetobacter sp. ANC 3781]